MRTSQDSLCPILAKTRVKKKKVKMLDLGIFLKFSFENKSGLDWILEKNTQSRCIQQIKEIIWTSFIK